MLLACCYCRATQKLSSNSMVWLGPKQGRRARHKAYKHGGSFYKLTSCLQNQLHGDSDISINVIEMNQECMLQAKHHHVSRSSIGASTPKANHFKSYWDRFGLRIHIKERRCSCLSVADSNHLGTDDKGPDGIELSISDDQESALNPSSMGGIAKPQASPDNKLESQISETSNGSMGSAVGKQERRPNLQSIAKKSPLTARERLKAARVLSRYAESKPSKKSEMGSKVLAALRESDRRKKTSGLPEAPTNMFDDSQRGLSQGAWDFQFPGGSDLLVIVFSFVFISTVMFATTYVVWKVGAIHFNEY